MSVEAKSRGACIKGVSDGPNEIYDHWIHIPEVEEIFYPLVAVVPLQLLAYTWLLVEVMTRISPVTWQNPSQ